MLSTTGQALRLLGGGPEGGHMKLGCQSNQAYLENGPRWDGCPWLGLKTEVGSQKDKNPNFQL